MAVTKKAAADGRIVVETACMNDGKITIKLRGAEGLTLLCV